MFEKSQSLLLRATASARSHNLDMIFWQGFSRAAVIHKSVVNIVIWSESGGILKTYELHSKDNSGSKNDIYQARWCFVNQTLVLVILSNIGVQIYDDTGKEMHFWYHFNTNGICGKTIYAFDNQLAVGTTDGKVILFSLGPRCSDAVLTDTLQASHNSTVTAISVTSRYLGCGSSDGSVTLWQRKSQFEKVGLQAFDSCSFPCTGICIWQGYVMVAYGSGCLRLFDIPSGQILSEIAAHAKWITALHCASSSGLILSVSEDSFVRVWQLKESHETVVSQKFSEHIPDKMLCGGAFLTAEGKSFAVTGFESEEIMCYSM